MISGAVRGDGTRSTWGLLAGAVVSLAAAVAVCARPGTDGTLTRDEAVYVYAAQQLAHGVPPYVSIVDPKGPLAPMIGGLGAWTAQRLGGDDVTAVRLVFGVCAVGAVIGLYLLAVQLWRSPLAGVTAAVVMVSFTGFAADALSGPDAKTPGVTFLVLSMWLMVRRAWFAAGLLGALAFLVWQPLAIYAAAAVLLPLLASGPGRRLRDAVRALVGATVPVLVVVAYFAAVGAVGPLVEGMLVLPATGLRRVDDTWARNVSGIEAVAGTQPELGTTLLWLGLALLVVAVVWRLGSARLGPPRGRSSSATPGAAPQDSRSALADPLVSVVFATFLGQAAFAVRDFQGYSDLYPLLPYGALGVAAGVGLVVGVLGGRGARWRLPVLVVPAVVALSLAVGSSWSALGRQSRDDSRAPGLSRQLSAACAVSLARVPGTPVWAMGDPSPVVLLHRRNPDRYVYLNSGLDRWKVRHLRGGFDAWTRQVAAADPSVVVVNGWFGPVWHQMQRWLRDQVAQAGWLGRWRVILSPDARARAAAQGVAVTEVPTRNALDTAARPLPPAPCASRAAIPPGGSDRRRGVGASPLPGRSPAPRAGDRPDSARGAAGPGAASRAAQVS